MPDPDSRIRVHTSMDFNVDGITVAVLMRYSGDDTKIMHITEGGYIQWDVVGPGLDTAPTFRISDAIGRALLDALLRHYQGSEDMHTVRADLLHERGRVDKLMTAVIDLADKALDAATGN